MADGATPLDGIAGPRPGEGADEVTCPHCGRPTPRAGPGILDCRHCGRSFALPRPGAATRADAAARGARSPTDVGLRATAAIAALATLVFYAAVVTPLAGSYVADLFGDRGWVPYLIAWLSAWAGALLVVKSRLLAAQRRALALDLLPRSAGSRVTRESAGRLRDHLRQLAPDRLPRSPVARALAPGASRSFLVETLDTALERFQLRGDPREVIDHLTTQSQLHANAVDGSYTMIRVFIWAIPLLGFIGTVIGISAAVAGFSDSVASAVDLEVMKQSIGGVTVGLGVAFDTTLLALVMSIAIMFPASSLQKAEEDFLAEVDAYCDEHLARRLEDPATRAPGGLDGLQGEIARLAESIARLDARLARSD